MKDGIRVSDPRLEPFVYGLIARSKRRLCVKLAIGIVVILNAGVQALMNPLWHAFWVVMFLIALTVVPWRRWTDAQRLMRAEEAQESRRPERTGSP